MLTRRAVSRASFSLLTVALLGAVGCYQPQGPGFSGLAPLTYESTEMSPKTVSLIDQRTGETVWSVDVPVNKQLVIRFYEGRNDDSFMPDVMNWRIMNIGQRFGDLDNEVPAPPRSARRVDMSLRPSPELANASSDN